MLKDLYTCTKGNEGICQTEMRNSSGKHAISPCLVGATSIAGDSILHPASIAGGSMRTMYIQVANCQARRRESCAARSVKKLISSRHVVC